LKYRSPLTHLHDLDHGVWIQQVFSASH
jgi:hypothetical protein